MTSLFLSPLSFFLLPLLLLKCLLSHRRKSELDEEMIYEILRCFRFIMNTEIGLQHVISDVDLINNFSNALYADLMTLRTLASELLSALCVLSPRAHGFALLLHP